MENNNSSSPPTNSQIKDNLLEIRKITQLLNSLNMILDSDELFVSDITKAIFDLWNSIEKLKNIININNEDINKINQNYLNLKNARQAADILSEEERKKMKIDLGTASSTIIKQLASHEPYNTSIKSSLSPYVNIQRITQNFIDLDLLLDSEELNVADILSIFLDLWNSIENLKNVININNEEINKIKQYYLNLKNNRKANDILSEKEIEKMKIDISIASHAIDEQLYS